MRSIRLALALLLALLAGSARAADPPPHRHGATERTAPEPRTLAGQSIYHVPGTWTTADGARGGLRALRGRPVALAMVYTTCTTACPLTITDLKRIEAALTPEARDRVWLALFSFDSERDRPDALARFAETRGLDPARWRLHHGDRAAVRALAMALGVRYKRDARGDFDHSNVITILDAEGVIRHRQIGLGSDPAESVRLLETLAR